MKIMLETNSSSQLLSTFPPLSTPSIIYIQNIGYGTLLDPFSHKQILIKQLPIDPQKKTSVHFDPDLFNQTHDSIRKKFMESGLYLQSNQHYLPANIQLRKSSQSTIPITLESNQNHIQLQNNLKQKPNQQNNIAIVRLENSKALVYTPKKTLRKHITIPIRPLFLPQPTLKYLKIQITKTIQSLKKQIFELLALKQAQYYNIKLFTTTPSLIQLNSPNKTIWQYSITQSSSLIMTAQHAFTLQNITYNYCQYFSVVNNNLTLIALPRKPSPPQLLPPNVVIALPPLPPPPNPLTNHNQISASIQKINISTQIIAPYVEISLPSPPPVSAKNNNDIVQNPQKISVQTQTNFTNFLKKQIQQSHSQQKHPQKQKEVLPAQQIKQKQIKPLPNNQPNKPNQLDQQQDIEQQQKIKLLKQPNKNELKSDQPDIIQIKADKWIKSGSHYFQVKLQKLPTQKQQLKIGVITLAGDKKWLFLPLKQLKIYQQNYEVKLSQNYGISFKQNDIVGILVKITKQKTMKLTFYKNCITLGLCFQATIQTIGFIFCLGSQGQITLDTRIQKPIDSYRLL